MNEGITKPPVARSIAKFIVRVSFSCIYRGHACVLVGPAVAAASTTELVRERVYKRLWIRDVPVGEFRGIRLKQYRRRRGRVHREHLWVGLG